MTYNPCRHPEAYRNDAGFLICPECSETIAIPPPTFDEFAKWKEPHAN
jgi:hypothetical protein